MKLSAYHKAAGDSVEWLYALEQYDRVYMSKVFDNTYSPDIPEPMNAKEIIKGGTGYGLENKLPYEIIHLQRWANNKMIFKKCTDFQDYMKQNKKGGLLNREQLKLQ